MTKRPYLSMIQQSVVEEGVTFTNIKQDYLYRVNLGSKTFIMRDLDIGLNNSSSAKIAMSKSNTYDVLNEANIPSVEHFFLINQMSRFCDINPYSLAKKYFHLLNGKVVLKQDNGSQGKNVFWIDSESELENKLNYIFSLQMNASISPFYKSLYEYRIIMLNGEPMLFLAKERTNSWKHNLIEGAISKDVEKEIIPILSSIAINTVKAIELDFCSVDILDTDEGLLVLEVNDQVMLDEYIKHDISRKMKVSEIYRNAIRERFKRIL